MENNFDEGETMNYYDNAYHINNSDEDNVAVDGGDEEKSSIEDKKNKSNVKEDDQCIINLGIADGSAAQADEEVPHVDEEVPNVEEEEEEVEGNIDMGEVDGNLGESDEVISIIGDMDCDDMTFELDPCSSCAKLCKILINAATENDMNINSSESISLLLGRFHSDCGAQLTTLHAACLFNNLQLVKLFVENGADVNAQTCDLCSPMHLLLYQPEADPNIVNYLISHGADLKLMNRQSETPLHIAAKASMTCTNAASAKSVKIIDMLLASGADPNVKNYFDELPVQLSKGNNIKVFKKLLERTDLTVINELEDIRSLLDFILRKDEPDCLEILCKSNCCKEFCLRNPYLFPYGWRFIKYRKICWISYLFNTYCLSVYSFESWKEMLHLMLESGLSINSKSPECIPPLSVATLTASVNKILDPDIMYITELIHCGADVNYPDDFSPEALLHSCRCKNPNIMSLLLQHSDYATPDSILSGYVKMDEIVNITPEVIELFFDLGITQSSVKLLCSHKTAVSDYYYGYIGTLKQLSRIAVRHLFYSKQSKSSVNEIMNKLPDSVCKYIKYETKKSDEQI